jgi:drug/metabolite transporter (DMT)-like permease
VITAGALLALPVAILSGPPRMPAINGAISLIGVGTLSTAFAWPLFYRVLRRTTPTAASTATFIVPAFAMLWGAIVLGEAVGIELIVGFGLIMVSLLLVLGIAPSFASGTRARARVAAVFATVLRAV